MSFFSFSRLSIVVIGSIVMSACQTFKVNEQYNEFRNQRECEMSGNKVSGLKNGRYVPLVMDFRLDENVNTHQKDASLVLSSSTANEFRQDSHLIFYLNEGQERLILQSQFSDSHSETIHSYQPGYYSGHYYVPGYMNTYQVHNSEAHFKMEPKNLDKIRLAQDISFDIESTQGKISGHFSAENMNNLADFSNKCYLGR